jgi:hypothetical protein
VRETGGVPDFAALRADCARCTGLCCVVPAFAASADFAIDKPAGQACPHLADDFRCSIHDRLRPNGFRGCTVYDCFGAGQHVTQLTASGGTWRDDSQQAERVFAAFTVARDLHELLWYLRQALALEVPPDLRAELTAEHDRLDRARQTVAEAFDVGPTAHAAVAELLLRVSDHVRGLVARSTPADDRRGADLMGRDLRGDDLAGASLRGAYLIGADLRGCRLHRTDLLGADLRDADLRGTDLRTSLFLTQRQVAAARGDLRTSLPVELLRPSHWSALPVVG